MYNKKYVCICLGIFLITCTRNYIYNKTYFKEKYEENISDTFTKKNMITESQADTYQKKTKSHHVYNNISNREVCIILVFM